MSGRKDSVIATLPARVSVIIPTKDRSACLRQALTSVRALEGDDLSLEVIVVDDGSIDDTAAVARQFGALHLRGTTPGAAATRNVGLMAATGEYVTFLDDDDIFTPQHIRPQLAVLEARPELAAVVGQRICADTALRPILAPIPQTLPADGYVFPAFLEQWPQLGTLVVRALLLQSVGLFDVRYPGGEDWDWTLRLALRYRIGFVPVPSLLFRVRPVGSETEDSATWGRVGVNRRVFWTNVWRSGAQRPSLKKTVRMYLHHRGFYADYFIRSALAHLSRGDRGAALRALLLGLRTSTPHVAWALLRRPDVRDALASALSSGAPAAMA
ncbi:MAG: glycosyltransferase family 2 protein [Chloroflexota bacterium]|nr:glycosyltransferase family 2 protein [Chloroflexota bacterium]